VTPKICVSILPRATDEAFRLIENAETARADLVEIRLDRFTNPEELADLAVHGKKPKIATIKPLSLGGEFSGGEAKRKRILLQAAKKGFDYVDIELENRDAKIVVGELKAAGAKPIVSFHAHANLLNFGELGCVLAREIAAGAEVCKIVVTPKRIEDNLTILNFTQTASTGTKVICFGMGKLGMISRLLSPLFGSFCTFASLKRGNETAPGQMAIQEMQAAYELLEIR
jgi:3-dehydroquinate dehydratase type I